jgi:general secretion pathway protein H
VVSAIRIAYNHANATSRPTRLVFDFESRTISIEESTGRMLLKSGDITGGAAAATDVEKAVVAESEEILEGPRAARPQFTPVGKILGFEYDEEKERGMKRLADGIFFRQLEVQHEDSAATEGRVYLYFWPGGQTELAAIQIQKGEGDVDDDDIITITVAPLTGKTVIRGGPIDMPRPRTDEDLSERADTI